MYAVVEIGGHQYKVSEGDVLFVDRQSGEKDEAISFGRVLLINDGKGNVTVGKPVVEGAVVEAKLLDNVKADKVIIFKKKRRKGYQLKRGHRQPMSQIEIEMISASGGGKKKKSAAKSKDAPAAKKEAAPKAEAKKETKAAKPKAKKESGAAKPKAKTKAAAPANVSTDMNADEAIDHIKNTPLDKLKGFVPDSESRVTVQRAWESKQEE